MHALVIYLEFVLSEVTEAGRSWVGRERSKPGIFILQASDKCFMSYFYLSFSEAGEQSLQDSSLIATGPWQNLYLGNEVMKFKFPGKIRSQNKFCGL